MYPSIEIGHMMTSHRYISLKLQGPLISSAMQGERFMSRCMQGLLARYCGMSYVRFAPNSIGQLEKLSGAWISHSPAYSGKL